MYKKTMILFIASTLLALPVVSVTSEKVNANVNSQSVTVAKSSSIVAGVPSMGIATTSIYAVAAELVSRMLSQVGSYKYGRVYKVRNWKYAGWRYQ